MLPVQLAVQGVHRTPAVGARELTRNLPHRVAIVTAAGLDLGLDELTGAILVILRAS
jgi:hypothetical protein